MSMTSVNKGPTMLIHDWVAEKIKKDGFKVKDLFYGTDAVFGDRYGFIALLNGSISPLLSDIDLNMDIVNYLIPVKFHLNPGVINLYANFTLDEVTESNVSVIPSHNFTYNTICIVNKDFKMIVSKDIGMEVIDTEKIGILNFDLEIKF